MLTPKYDIMGDEYSRDGLIKMIFKPSQNQSFYLIYVWELVLF